MNNATTARKRGGRPRIETPNPVDIHVGARVKQRRLMLGMSQDHLAKKLLLTFQQIQKYERGTNRISASRLHEIARILSVPVPYFFENLSTGASGFAEEIQQPYAADPLENRETMELVRAFARLSDSTVRKRILEMVKAMANAGANDPD